VTEIPRESLSLEFTLTTAGKTLAPQSTRASVDWRPAPTADCPMFTRHKYRMYRRR
jgi:hypothetical protein